MRRLNNTGQRSITRSISSTIHLPLLATGGARVIGTTKIRVGTRFGTEQVVSDTATVTTSAIRPIMAETTIRVFMEYPARTMVARAIEATKDCGTEPVMDHRKVGYFVTTFRPQNRLFTMHTIIESRNEMVLAHTKIVEAHVKYYSRWYRDKEALQQEGFLGVIYAIDNWRSDMGKSLDQYVRQSVDWKMKNAIRAHKKIKILPNEFLDTSEIDKRFEQIENREYVLNLTKFVSYRQAVVLTHLYVEGECTNFPEVADKMGITREGVRQLYNKAMATLIQSVWGSLQVGSRRDVN
jgi:RNA polymerase sigma factor (sigma-70 family)